MSFPIFNDGYNSIMMSHSGQRTFTKGCNSCNCCGFKAQYGNSGPDRIYGTKPDFFAIESCRRQ